jgi:sugar phosphate isomerase/epimerase
MKLCISNIAWEPQEDDQIVPILQAFGVEGLEVAPTKGWPDPTQATDESIAAYRERWQSRSITIPAMQALLFGHPELKIFEDAATRDLTLQYLSKICELGSKLGARVLVFGSPKNRLAGALAPEAALEIGADFFRRAGAIAQAHGVQIGIEPNPPQYGCDFIQTVAQALELVRRVDHPGFGLHVDVSSIILNGEPVEATLAQAAEAMIHFHVSEPQLGLIGTSGEIHRRVAQALRQIHWNGWISIEMRSGAMSENASAVEHALAFVRDTYFQ